MTKKEKKVEEEKFMIEDDKMILINRLEEKTLDVKNISNMHLDTMNLLIISNHKLNGTRDELKCSLKRRKEMTIKENDTQFPRD